MMQDDIETTRSYSNKETAYYLGFSESYTRRLINSGRIKATKPNGGQYRVTGAEILRVKEGMEGEGRVPSTNEDSAATEIHVSQQAANQIFSNAPPSGQDISPPDQDADGGDGSIYDMMRRKYPEG